jgi:hypothetical protein
MCVDCGPCCTNEAHSQACYAGSLEQQITGSCPWNKVASCVVTTKHLVLPCAMPHAHFQPTYRVPSWTIPQGHSTTWPDGPCPIFCVGPAHCAPTLVSTLELVATNLHLHLFTCLDYHRRKVYCGCCDTPPGSPHGTLQHYVLSNKPDPALNLGP